MSATKWWPPFNQAQPGWEDGDGFVQNTVAAAEATEQSGSKIVPKNADRVTVVFPTPLTLGTSYSIDVTTENLAAGDPPEQIYPTQLVSRNKTSTSEVGFTYLLNAAPSVGTGIIGTEGENSNVQFNWKIHYNA